MSLIPLEVRPHSPPSSSPIPNAILALSDYNKNGFSVLIQHSGVKHVTYILSNPGFVQLGEQLALLNVLMSLSVFSLTSCMQFRLFILCPLPSQRTNKSFLSVHAVHVRHISSESIPLVYFSHPVTHWTSRHPTQGQN